MMLKIILFTFVLVQVECVLYDRYLGKKLNDTEIRDYAIRNLTSQCTIDVKLCTPHEGSRVDGTCTSFKHPSSGSAFTPYLRLLPPEYSRFINIRVSKNGEDLPSARRVRTMLQSTGRVVNKHFNMAAVHLMTFVAYDMNAIDGILDYLTQRTYCCEEAGRADPRCIPIRVPEDDPYLKVTDIRCLNFSRAETFQDVGCIPKTIPPEQINLQTPRLDLSTVYGIDDKALANIREEKDGLLKMETRNGRYVPLGDAGSNACFQNMTDESMCYRFGNPTIGNFYLPLSTFTIFFMREHNRLAKELAKLNPCWKDDRLFKVARQINIAAATNIYMYELLPILLGYKNMVNYGLISNRVEHLVAYDRDAKINLYSEYVIAMRFFHTFIDGRIKKYNEKYRETNELSISDTFFRPSLLEQNSTFEEINRGTFYQRAAHLDDIADPELVETFFGKLQRAHDLVAIDIQRGRDLGVRGYNDYRKLCGGKPAAKFEEFVDVMSIEKIDALKKLYDEVDDVDLLAGIMSENFIEDGFLGPTLFCIMTKQIQLLRFGDRFWFERGDQVHSFNLGQLNEIRRTNMARFSCDNIEGIKFIQPRAFLNVMFGNEPIPCEHIPGMDLTKWIDVSCQPSEKNSKKTDSYFQFLKLKK